MHVETEWGHVVDYQVDGLGRRILKKLDGTVTARYIYGRGLGPVAVLDSNNQLAARFIYGSRANVPDLMVLRDGTILRFVCDQLGSPIMLVNVANGTVVQSIDYDDFGVSSLSTNLSSGFPNSSDDIQPFGFAGGMYDVDTRLVRFGARDYDPEVGRWISKDPILFKGGQTNFYVYAANDPINHVDSNGEFAQIAAAAFLGASLNVVGYVALTSVSDTSWAGVGAAALGGALAGASTALGGPVWAAIGGGVGYAAEAAISGSGNLEGLTAAVLSNAIGAQLGVESLNKLLQLTDNYALAQGALLAGRGVRELANGAEVEAAARTLGGNTALSFLGRWADQAASPTPCPVKH
jgi:RHS repeat-associated protein